MRYIALILLMMLVLVGCVESTRYDPCSAGNKVACNLAQAQAAATIQAQDAVRISEATRVAIDAETTKIAAYAQATTAANHAIAQATRSVIDARSTAQSAEIAATKQAYEAQATATKRADDAQATSDARQIESTQQALVAELTRTALRYEETRAAVTIENDQRQAEIEKNQKIQAAQTAAAREIASEVIGVIVTVGLAATLVIGVWYGMKALTLWLRNRAATVRAGERDKPVLVFDLPGGKIRIIDPDRMIGPAMGPEMEHQPNDWKLLERVTARDQLVDLYHRMPAAEVREQTAVRSLPAVSAPPMLDIARAFLPEVVDLPAALPPDQLIIGVGSDGPIGGSRRDIRGVLAAGAPRSGKSTTLRSLAYQAALAGWQLYLCDPMSNTFVPELWNRVPAVAYPVAESPPQLLEMLDTLEAECQRRAQLFRNIAHGQIPPEDLEGYNTLAQEKLAPLILIADEFNTFANASEVLEPLTDLARRGQKWGLLIVLAAHSWRSRDIPRATADLLQSRIVFRLNSREAARTILDGGAAAMVTHLTQPGRAVVVLNGDSQQVQTYRVDVALGRIVSLSPQAVFIPLFRQVPMLVEREFGMFVPIWPPAVAAEVLTIDPPRPIASPIDQGVALPFVVDDPRTIDPAVRIAPALSQALIKCREADLTPEKVLQVMSLDRPALPADLRKWPLAVGETMLLNEMLARPAESVDVLATSMLLWDHVINTAVPRDSEQLIQQIHAVLSKRRGVVPGGCVAC